MDRLTDKIERLEKVLILVRGHLVLCQDIENRRHEVYSSIVLGDCIFHDCEAYGIKFRSPYFMSLNKKSVLSPRIVPDANTTLDTHINTRSICLKINLDFFEACKSFILREQEFVESYGKNRRIYAVRVNLCEEMELHSRRQKAMKREFMERKRRLENLRMTRMANLRALKEKAVIETTGALEAIKPKGKSLSQHMKEFTRKAFRGMKDYIRDMGHASAVRMDEEERRMALKVTSKSTIGNTGNKVEGIRRLHMTSSEFEAENFSRIQNVLSTKGLPHFKKMKKALENQLYIWYQMSQESTEFITSLEFHHKDQSNPLYLGDQLYADENEYEIIGHRDTNLQIWIKREKVKVSALCEIDVAFTEIEENRLLDGKFQRVNESLDKFDLPDITFWYRKCDKIITVAAASTDALILEFKKTRQMLRDNPHDKNLQSLFIRARERLEDAHENEKSAEVTNPLQNAIDLMALDASDLEQWMEYYSSMDPRVGSEEEALLTIDDVFTYLEETPTEVAKEIFYSMDALDEEGNIEFGDFVRSVGTFCFFGVEEICKFLFVYCDKEKEGEISHEQFISLVNVVNPYDKKMARRALKEINLVPGKKMEFKEFARVNANFPTLFHPVFKFQNNLKNTFMGNDWWYKKLTKYKGVRKKLEMGSRNTDVVAAQEIERFSQDLEREKRMKVRAEEIRHETSTLRKALLEARQFVDEIT